MTDALDMDAVRDDILLSTLPNVVFDGWSAQAMRDGAQLAGYDAATLQRAFPGGVVEVAEHFGRWTDRRMLEELETHPLDEMKVRDKITLAIQTHFDLLAPHQEAKRRLIAFLALPQNIGLGLTMLYRTVDAMWYAAGDTATDFNHYSKRATLAAVLSAATFYWLDDPSEGRRDTMAFVGRRLKDVMALGRATSSVGKVGQILSHLPSPMRFARQIRQRTPAAQASNATVHMADNI